MEYRIEIEEYLTEKFIHTSIIGTMSEKERNEIGRKTILKMREKGINKVIWDIRESELNYSLIGSHMAIMNLEELGVKKSDYLAIIYFHNEDQHEYAKIVASNRGLYNVNYFKNIDEGIEWLKSRQ